MWDLATSMHDAFWRWWMDADWKDGLEAFFVLMSVIGQHFIAQRKVAGFFFWIVGNVAALILFAALGRWLTCLLYVYFLLASLHGVKTWKVLDAAALDAQPLKGRS